MRPFSLSRNGNRRRRSPLLALFSFVAVCFVVRLLWVRFSFRRHAIVAYFIQASESNYEQVPRLVGALCDPTQGSIIAVHIDASVPALLSENTVGAARANCPSARILVVPPEYVTYRGITLALNYISGATTLLQSGIHFEYLINLSGADYPTARPQLIAQLLAHAAPYRLSFAEWKPRQTWRRFARGRLGRIFVDTALVSYVNGDDDDNNNNGNSSRGQYFLPPNEDEGYPAAPPEWRNPAWPHVGFTVAKTSGWFIWHRELVEHLVLDGIPRRMYSAFALSDASDEHIYATLMWNSDYYRTRTVDNNWRNIFFIAPNGSYALADDGVSRKRQHPYFVDDVDDTTGELLFWDQLWNSPALFTRKVRREGNVTDMIDHHMLKTNPDSQQNVYERRLRGNFRTVLRNHFQTFPNATMLSHFRSVFVT